MSATAEVLDVENSKPEELSQAKIFRFFSPLALSWIFMSIEGPLAVALISRMPNPEVGTAAFQIMMGLAFWIESPIIDLLSTSTTLARSRQNYAMLSKFVWYLIATVALAHFLVVFTPLFWLISERVMGVPHSVAAMARMGLMTMLPWAGIIGWRRYLQGLLIRNGRTKLVGLGTFVRLGMMVASAFALYLLAPLEGVQIAGISLVCAVAAEAAFIHWASRDVVRTHYRIDSPGQIEAEDIPMAKLRRFHLPLTATTLMTMMGTPIVSAALAHSPDSVLQLAGYQVAMTLVWLMRTVMYALPEVVITLYRDESSAEALLKFCMRAGLIASSLMALVWLTGLDRLLFAEVLGATSAEVPVARLAFIASVLMPAIGAGQSYVRGMLTAHHLTVSRMVAVLISMLTLLAALLVTTVTHTNNVAAAGVCLTLAFLAELGFLLSSWKRRESVLPATA